VAHVTCWPPLRHLRSGPNEHVLLFRNGQLIRSGRGIAFWFFPLTASIAEIPCDDRDQPFLFQGRSRDHQDVTVQGTITYRVTQPEELARHIDFTIDVNSGLYRKTPLEQLSELLTQLAQQLAWDHLNLTPLRELLARGVDEVRTRIRKGLDADPNLAAIGLQIVSVRVADLSPNADLEKALQAPTREAIQQESDEAVFHRRAVAVEKERAIAENELQNRIELAKREEELIAQQGLNRKQEARESAEARKIQAEAAAERRQLGAAAEAESIRMVEEAQVEADARRMDVYRDLPPHVMWGLAAREMAGNLRHIDHLNLGTDAIGPLLTNLVHAGVRNLEQRNGEHESS
jgi:regulator of protease activity HflC (stomatin/prohibitin superfamily)